MRRRTLSALMRGVAAAVLALGDPGIALAQAATAPPAAGAQQDETETLRARVGSYWAARLSGNGSAQWELLEPRARGRMSAAEYTTPAGPVKYMAYQVEDAKIDGLFATVNVRLLIQVIVPSAMPRAMPPSAVVVPDRWVRVRGVWYRTMDQE